MWAIREPLLETSMAGLLPCARELVNCVNVRPFPARTIGIDLADLHKMAPRAGDGTTFLVIEAISPQEYLTLDQHLTARAKRQGKSAQARLLESLFTNPLIFHPSRVMR